MESKLDNLQNMKYKWSINTWKKILDTFSHKGSANQNTQISSLSRQEGYDQETRKNAVKSGLIFTLPFPLFLPFFSFYPFLHVCVCMCIYISKNVISATSMESNTKPQLQIRLRYYSKRKFKKQNKQRTKTTQEVEQFFYPGVWFNF